MRTREDLSQEEIKELESRASQYCKPISLFTAKELCDIADDNHIWLNAFSCISPTPAFEQEVGRMILQKLRETELRDYFGISHEIILTINKS